MMDAIERAVLALLWCAACQVRERRPKIYRDQLSDDHQSLTRQLNERDRKLP